MNKKTFKNSNGITLIALVVTIVVLLILAGISISMVLGNNGLITKAKDAKTQTEQDQQNTELAINSLVDEMDAILGNSGSGDSDGTGDSGEGDGDPSDKTPTTPQIGDYVNYTYDTVADGYSLLATQSGYDDDQTIAQSSTTLKWRILDIDEESGTIDLVSSGPSDNTVYFSGALGYHNGVYLLNDMCAKLYSNSSLGVTARSINLADMENHLTADGFAARNAYTSGVQYGTTKTYTGSYSYYPNLYASQIGAGINTTSITQPDIDGTVDPYNESDSYYSTPTTETYSQASDSGLTVTQTYYGGSNFNFRTSGYYDEAGEVLYSSTFYWVASRAVDANTAYVNAFFGLRRAEWNPASGSVFRSDGYTANNVGRLRPVVSLSSELLTGTKDADGAWNLVSE